MMPDDFEDDQFTRLLLEYEAELADGRLADASARFAGVRDAHLAKRLTQAAKCVALLRQTLGNPVEEIPSQISRFTIIRELGRGGFGTVYLAFDRDMKREIALKLQRPETALSAEISRRFLREVHAAARLQHPNIIAIYEMGEAGALGWIAGEYCPGGSLAAWIESNPDRPSPQEAARFVARLADAVSYAHERGVLHRDIKPSNILVFQRNMTGPIDGAGRRVRLADCEPKLTDFGLAKLSDGQPGDTRSVAMIGTPGYMSPEQALGTSHDLDERSDVYSLGVILYELITGRRPFNGSPDSVVRDVLHKNPEPPRAVSRNIPRDLEFVCLKAIAKDRSDRYQSAREYAADLRLCAEGSPISGRRGQAVRHALKASRRRLAAIVLAVIALGFASRVWYLEATAPPDRMADRRVRLTTEPAGARVAFVPLSDYSGEPIAANAILSTGRTPVELDLQPGRYFVEALLDDGRFHEVQRYVPKRDEAWLQGRRDPSGVIELAKVKIPALGAASRMLQVSSDVGSILYVDKEALTAAAARQSTNLAQGRTDAMAPERPPVLTYELAVGHAESLGKRLPSEEEWQQAHAALGDSGVQIAVWTTTTALVPTNRGNSHVATDAGTFAQLRVIRGGSQRVLRGDSNLSNTDFGPQHRLLVEPDSANPGVGMRCVRSAVPRFVRP